MPMNIGKKYLNAWMLELGKDAFFAPIFFLLFYLSLLILQQGTAALGAKNINPVADYDGILTIGLSMMFIIFSIVFARKAGGVVTETTISLGKGALGLAAMGVTAGAGAGASLMLARTGAGAKIEGAVQGLRERPFLGKVTRPLTERTLGYLEKERAKVGEHQKKIKNRSDDLVVSDYKSAVWGHEKVAAAKELAERGKLNLLAGREAEALQLATRYQEQDKILKAVPHLATPELVANTANITEAKQKIIEKIRPNELANMAVGALVDPETVDLLIKTMSPEHWRQLARSNNQELFRTLQEKINARPELVGNMKADSYRFLSSNAAQGMGLTLPTGTGAPHEINIEEGGEMDRRIAELNLQIQELEQRALDFENIGNIKEATKIRGVQKKELERKRDNVKQHGIY